MSFYVQDLAARLKLFLVEFFLIKKIISLTQDKKSQPNTNLLEFKNFNYA